MRYLRSFLGVERPSISDIIHQAIADKVFPGAAVAFGTCDLPCYCKGYGTYTYESSIPVNLESIWDLASLTKIMATVSAIMILYDQQLIDLDAPACLYLPEFGMNGKESITVRMLLTHTSGLREFYPFFSMGIRESKLVKEFILSDNVSYPVGMYARYSDHSMIILAFIIEKITNVDFDQFVFSELFNPLGMKCTCFRSIRSSDFDPKVIPTEVDSLNRRRLLWGEVHDPTAWLLGGIAGNAGLFSSILDICKFSQMILAGGIDLRTNRRYFSEKTLTLFTMQQNKTKNNPRPFALGWDVSERRSLDGYTSAGQFMGKRTFGHTGFTGTSLWIDPDRNLFVVLLSNSVHPSVMQESNGSLKDVRPKIADAAVMAMNELIIPREVLTWHVRHLPLNPAKGVADEAFHSQHESNTKAKPLANLTHTKSTGSEKRIFSQSTKFLLPLAVLGVVSAVLCR